MDTIYSGAGVFWIVGFLALFMLPLVTLFKPVLPIALSITLLITGYLCITVAVEQVKDATAMGVAGIMGVVLAVMVQPGWGSVSSSTSSSNAAEASAEHAEDEPEEPIHRGEGR
ncbi:MAG: hypothetical protein U5L98_11360 [Halomonas sp.]|uniref:hypothetical protein n=1 Tax=Halomonas sp. TaxID=1486246 RepID=UPI002ACE0A69|nr:hypothetical protein [Halomonas sp.]MDZ7853212.1 hypothetical protein [Halomonas sp.]